MDSRSKEQDKARRLRQVTDARKLDVETAIELGLEHDMENKVPENNPEERRRLREQESR